MLLVPISANAETDAQLEAAKAETLRLAQQGAEADTAPAWWPWKGGEQEKPPALKIYKMPTMADDSLDYHAKPCDALSGDLSIRQNAQVSWHSWLSFMAKACSVDNCVVSMQSYMRSP